MLLLNNFVLIALPPSRRLRFSETIRSMPCRSQRARGQAPWLAAAAALVFFGGLAFAAEPTFTVVPDHATGVYAPDEKVTWIIDVKGDRRGKADDDPVVATQDVEREAKSSLQECVR